VISSNRARLLASAMSHSSSFDWSSSLLCPSTTDDDDFWRAAFIADFLSNKLMTRDDADDVSDLLCWRWQVSDDTLGGSTARLRSDALLQFMAGDQCWDDDDALCRPTTRFNGVSSAMLTADVPNFTSSLAADCGGCRRGTSAAVPFLSDLLRCSSGGGGLSELLPECDSGLANLFRWLVAASAREATSNGRWNFCSGWVAAATGGPPREGIVNVNGKSLSAEDGRLTSFLPGDSRRESFTDLSCSGCCYANMHTEK